MRVEQMGVDLHWDLCWGRWGLRRGCEGRNGVVKVGNLRAFRDEEDSIFDGVLWCCNEEIGRAHV